MPYSSKQHKQETSFKKEIRRGLNDNNLLKIKKGMVTLLQYPF